MRAQRGSSRGGSGGEQQGTGQEYKGGRQQVTGQGSSALGAQQGTCRGGSAVVISQASPLLRTPLVAPMSSVRVRDKPSHLGTPILYVRVLEPQPAPCATSVCVRDKPRHHGTPVLYVRVRGWLAPTVITVRVMGGHREERCRQLLVSNTMDRKHTMSSGDGLSKPHVMNTLGSCSRRGSKHIWGQ